MSVRKAKRKLRAWEKYYQKSNHYWPLRLGTMSPKITDGYRRAWQQYLRNKHRNARMMRYRWTGEIARMHVAKHGR